MRRSCRETPRSKFSVPKLEASVDGFDILQQNTFLTPQAPRHTKPVTNTAIKPSSNHSGLGSFHGKPYRPARALDFGRQRPSVIVEAPVEENAAEEADPTPKVEQEPEDEEAKKQQVHSRESSVLVWL